MKNVFQFLTAFILCFLILGCEAPHEHLYEKTIVEATCTEQGYTEFICEYSDTYKENYTFNGWYLDAEYNDEYNFGDLITEDITLFAKFNYN